MALAVGLAFPGLWGVPGTGGLTGQSPPSLGSEGAVAGELRVAPALGQLRGNGLPFLRGSAMLHLNPWLSIGGETVLPLAELRTTSPGNPDRSELHLRYGGVRASAQRPSLGSDDPWTVSLLLGAGTARVRSSLLDTELGADNFLVIEPGVERHLTTLGPARIGGGVAYRLPIGARSLPGVRPGQLRGASLFVSLALRRDP